MTPNQSVVVYPWWDDYPGDERGSVTMRVRNGSKPITGEMVEQVSVTLTARQAAALARLLHETATTAVLNAHQIHGDRPVTYDEQVIQPEEVEPE